jgi:hypothetical protein
MMPLRPRCAAAAMSSPAISYEVVDLNDDLPEKHRATVSPV